MNIVISPWSRPLRNGKLNPKNYPYWEELVNLLVGAGHKVVQIGRSGEKRVNGVHEFLVDLPLKRVEELIVSSDTWISVDNFLQHLCNLICKRGTVIWGPSDPNIFGYKSNLNILKHRSHLREKQFDIWETCEYSSDRFLPANDVFNAFCGEFKNA